MILETAGTTSGFDSAGHFLRSLLVPIVSCVPYCGCRAEPPAALRRSERSPAPTATSTTATPPADALDAAAAAHDGDPVAGDGSRRRWSTTSAPATGETGGAPAGSGLLSYLLGGSGER